VTGAVESVYQATRVLTICNELGLEVFNPLWQKPQVELVEDLIAEQFEVVVVGVAAFPLDKSWLGRSIDEKFLEQMKEINEKMGISVAGEGGEFESFVVNCPLFKKRLEIKSFEDSSTGENSCRREIELGEVK
jgi:diphthine-ammonia ligase